MQIRRGHSVLRLTDVLGDIGLLSGDTLSVDFRLSPRIRALRRREQGITKRSIAHDHRGRRSLASKSVRRRSTASAEADAILLGERMSRRSRASCLLDVQGPSASAASHELRHCRMSKKHCGELTPSMPVATLSPTQCEVDADVGRAVDAPAPADNVAPEQRTGDTQAAWRARRRYPLHPDSNGFFVRGRKDKDGSWKPVPCSCVECLQASAPVEKFATAEEGVQHELAALQMRRDRWKNLKAQQQKRALRKNLMAQQHKCARLRVPKADAILPAWLHKYDVM